MAGAKAIFSLKSENTVACN